ncbi:MAG: tripartite tricarboxylate transporter substrate-binding protein [Pseudomonadota bacterium]|nr:tripartite tricarboxylate transporter substrate-binding protein [Pseudomonadota bacterium]
MKNKILGLAIIMVSFLPLASHADKVSDFYKGKTVKIVIGGSMGGAYGLYAQLLSRHVNRHIAGNPTVVVQSMPGSGGNKAMNYTTNAGPQNGSMVSIVQISVVQETLFNPKIRFNAKNYKYIGRFADANIVAMAHKRSGFKSWKDAKKKQYTFGSIGRRNYTYIGVAAMNMFAGTKFKIISGYRGTKTSFMAVERGELDASATSWTTLNVRHADDIKSGKLKPIFQMASNRKPYLPNTPSVVEFGRNKAEKTFLAVIGAGSEIGRSMAGPPGMPNHLVAAWRKGFDKTMADKDFIADIKKRKSRLNPMNAKNLTGVVNSVMTLPKADIKGAFDVYTKLLKAKF